MAFCPDLPEVPGVRNNHMEKIQIQTNFFIPMPVVLVGTRAEGKANFMAVGWCARVNGNPPMIACGIAKNHYTPKGMEESKTFSVNIPSSDLLEKTDYCGLVSGAKTDKSAVFDVFYGSLETAPMIKECPVCLECRLARTVDLPTHYLYIGEIVGAYADERVLKDGKPDFPAIDLLFLTMPDNRYWSLGKCAGDAWSAGKTLMQKLHNGTKKGH
jgi:flavin reductase (DIM6/NTAB) family NADH-FMN oxidoreductase RutF